MNLTSLINSILVIVFLSGFQFQEHDLSGFEPGLHEYHYVSIYFPNDDISKGSWVKPTHLNNKNHVAYKIIRKDLIYKGYFDKSKKTYRWGDTLLRVPDSKLADYAPVPKNVLDFNLVGVYYFDRRFSDSFKVLYYSKKRNSVIEETHIYTLNRIEAIVLYMNKPTHPFEDVKKYFKIYDPKDSIYRAPVQKMF